jgi:ABC-type nickel/cobalt efflux system permease component RcnA
MTMHRKFIVLIIGAALTVSSLAATPVQAQNRGETAAIIAGVAALAIVGAAISDDRNRDRDRRNDYATRGHGYKQPYYAPKRHHKHGYNPGHNRHHYSQNRYYEPQRGYGRPNQGRPVYQRGYGNHLPYHRDDHRN